MKNKDALTKNFLIRKETTIETISIMTNVI